MYMYIQYVYEDCTCVGDAAASSGDSQLRAATRRLHVEYRHGPWCQSFYPLAETLHNTVTTLLEQSHPQQWGLQPTCTCTSIQSHQNIHVHMHKNFIYL